MRKRILAWTWEEAEMILGRWAKVHNWHAKRARRLLCVLAASLVMTTGCATTSDAFKSSRPFVSAWVDGAGFEVTNISSVEAAITIDEETGAQEVTVKTSRENFYNQAFGFVAGLLLR